MSSYILKRLATLFVVLLGITIFAFGLGLLSGGDPARIALSGSEERLVSAEELAAMRHEMGLDRPFMIQYLDWMGGVLQGDFGTSLITGEEILPNILRRLPMTIYLALFSMTLTIIFGLGLGITMGLYHNRFLDVLLNFFSTLSMSLPSFWVALLCMTIFSEHLRWLDTSGYYGFRSLIMPAMVLSLGSIGAVARLVRANFIREQGQAYVLVANSKGLRQKAITVRHILRNALLPVVTLLGMEFAGILGGSTIIESIFSLPGVGAYALTGIQNRDYFIIQAYVLYTGFTYVVITLAIDLLYFAINPKLKLKGEHQ